MVNWLGPMKASIDRAARRSNPTYRQNCGGRLPWIMQRKQDGFVHTSRPYFHNTCMGQISQCSINVHNFRAVP
jgi:hypothetical protein